MNAAYSEISKCTRCGFCQNVCPTYQGSHNESQVARGRIHLMRLLIDGRYDWREDAGISDKIDDCLLCRACVVNCPSSVGVDEIMRNARRDFLAAKGSSLFHRLVYRGGLSHRERIDRASFLMRLYEKSGARNILYGQVLRKALDRLVYFDSFLPAGLSPPARKTLPQVVRPAGRAKMKVGFFVGCASNVFGGRMVETLVRYLAGRGVEVHLPPVSCCGQPHLSAGDDAEAQRLARANLDNIFAGDYDYIVTDCSTCAHALSHYDDFLGMDTPEADRIRPKLGRVLEINTLVRDHLEIKNDSLKALPETVVTVHDPCHAVRGLGIKEAPRDILKSIPGVAVVEMAGADSCCGGAGSYSFSHPGMSGRIAADKVENIRATKASTLAVACPACNLQLGAGLRRAGLAVNVVHPVELLARSAGA